jgi:hypothetical protein
MEKGLEREPRDRGGSTVAHRRGLYDTGDKRPTTIASDCNPA